MADILFSQRTLDPTSVSLDASQRLRVSQLRTLGDYKIIGSDSNLLFNNEGTGTASFVENKLNMSVASGQFYVRQSRTFHQYFSGKSQVIELTAINFTGSVSLRIVRNGVDVLNVAQASWNQNTLTGHDWSKFNVILIDFLWLGGAALRLFVKTENGFTLCHVWNGGGVISDTFIKSPNQPIRYEIRNDTTNTTKRMGYFSSSNVSPFSSDIDGIFLESVSAGSSGSLTYVCSQVSTEGSLDENGLGGSIFVTTPIPLALAGTDYTVLAIRSTSGFNDVIKQITDLQAFINTNDQARWALTLNPTITGTPTWVTSTDFKIDFAVGTGGLTQTGGTVINTGYISENSISTTQSENFLSILGSRLNGTSDIITLSIIPITASINGFGKIKFKQF